MFKVFKVIHIAAAAAIVLGTAKPRLRQSQF